MLNLCCICRIVYFVTDDNLDKKALRPYLCSYVSSVHSEGKKHVRDLNSACDTYLTHWVDVNVFT